MPLHSQHHFDFSSAPISISRLESPSTYCLDCRDPPAELAGINQAPAIAQPLFHCPNETPCRWHHWMGFLR